MHKSGGWFLPGMIVLGTVVASACTQTYSQAPLTTPTLIPTGLFVSPFPAGQDPLKVVADLGTQTAVAKTAQAGGATVPATPAPGDATAVEGPVTPGPVTVEPITTSEAPLPTAELGSGGRPASYTLQAGEFPYCIARRFNVNPDDLLSANGLTEGSSVYPGTALTIPQTGSFPGDRTLNPHPDTYTVDAAGATLGSVACYYGDVSPQDIAAANGLSLSSTLSVGQQLTIP
jgi:LysM repeat protein